MGVDVVFDYSQVDDSECHLKFDGKLYVGEEEVESNSHSVADVPGLEADDGFVVIVSVLEKRGKVKSSRSAGYEVWAEIGVPHGAELKFHRQFAI